MARKHLRPSLCGALTCLVVACAPFEYRHGIRWNAKQEIWQAEASQVKVRDAQSRVYDTADKARMVEAIVATFQDLGFQIGVLDETLGIVSGKKFTGFYRPADSSWSSDPTYYLYDEEALVAFTRTYRRWGPFWHRSDLVRLTVTVRARNERQLVVRASAQFYLQPVENAASYEPFFQTLEGSLQREQSAAR